jgi:hypothetical protein
VEDRALLIMFLSGIPFLSVAFLLGYLLWERYTDRRKR